MSGQKKLRSNFRVAARRTLESLVSEIHREIENTFIVLFGGRFPLYEIPGLLQAHLPFNKKRFWYIIVADLFNF